MPGYNPQAIEKKWQAKWAREGTFATRVGKGGGAEKPKYYVLDMFPYPSGQGLHVGHPEGYTATDIVARYKRGRGFNVMHPMGWDAFGLPAEQYAIKNNVHPRETTANNIKRFREQLQSLGFSYDWNREVDTTDPGYYKWTQWIFLKLYDTWFDEEKQKGRPIAELVEEFKSGARLVHVRWSAQPEPPSTPDEREPSPKVGDKAYPSWESLTPTERREILATYRLAFQEDAEVNWCAGLGTVLANEEVVDGKSEVGGFPVERRPMRQWMLRITDYSERLLSGLDGLDWSESLKAMQRNWIGRSEGAKVSFRVLAPEQTHSGAHARTMDVFTTRPDTLYGATFMVMAPESSLVEHLTSDEQWPEVQKYIAWTASRSERERQEDTRKTGVFTGAHAINPLNGERLPIYIADYVLAGYGTGSIMAVPAHDERDHEFALKFKLPIVQVVAKKGEQIDVQKEPFCEEGVAVNSPWIEGLPTAEAKAKIISLLEEKGIGKRRVNYKIRDWLFSRQRYWGEPFPLVHLEDGTTVRLADDQLPVRLPELADFKPTGTIDPPLSKAAAWKDVDVELSVVSGQWSARVVPAGTPESVKARRELNTMPQWAGSCWYYIRYLDARDEKAFVDPTAEKYWLHDGVDLYVGGVEHAVLHLLYSRFWHKVLFDWGLVSCQEPFRRLVNQGMILGENNEKMSKSRGNVVTSDSMVEAYGADSLRLFEMFMGPLEQVKPWSTAGVEGVYRFLQRVWRNLFDENDAPRATAGSDDVLKKPLHRMIKKVTEDIERLSFNTAIAEMMKFNNLVGDAGAISHEIAITFLRLLEPFAPHFAEEAYERLGGGDGGGGSISLLPWPGYDPAMLVDATIEIPVQVNGKLRSRVTVASDADEGAAIAAALADAEVQKFLAGKEPKKKIYVKGRLVNIVV